MGLVGYSYRGETINEKEKMSNNDKKLIMIKNIKFYSIFSNLWIICNIITFVIVMIFYHDNSRISAIAILVLLIISIPYFVIMRIMIIALKKSQKEMTQASHINKEKASKS